MDDICGVAALRSSHSRHFTPHWRCFHSHHGSNIVLCDNDTTALRKASFANGIAFSRCPLMPGEIFCVEIEKNETGWSGNLRIGLTTFSPDSHAPIPAYGLPDLVNEHQSWLVAVKKPASPASRVGSTSTAVAVGTGSDGDHAAESTGASDESDNLARSQVQDRGLCGTSSGSGAGPDSSSSVTSGGCVGRVRSCRDSRHNQSHSRSSLPSFCVRGVCEDFAATTTAITSCSPLSGGEQSVGLATPRHADRVCRSGRLATDVGSRLGVMFVPSAESGLRSANMHVIINGEDQGAVCGGIPHVSRSLYAVVDVYGATKQVRIVQLHGVQPLMSKCRDVILEHMRCESVWQLPLPSTLKHYMAFNA